MIINKSELREVVKNLLLKEVGLKLKYREAPHYIQMLLGREGVYTQIGGGSSKSQTGGSISDPKEFDLKKAYEAIIKNQSTNRAKPDTLVLLPAFGAQIDLSSLDTSKIKPAYDDSLKQLEQRIDKAARVHPGGTLDEILVNLDTLIKPLNLGLSQVNIDQLKNFYTENHKSGKREEEAVKFLERVSEKMFDYLPKRLAMTKPDIEFAANEKDATGNSLLTQADVDRFDNLLQKVENLS